MKKSDIAIYNKFKELKPNRDDYKAFTSIASMIPYMAALETYITNIEKLFEGGFKSDDMIANDVSTKLPQL